jgi:hypothetical protein
MYEITIDELTDWTRVEHLTAYQSHRIPASPGAQHFTTQHNQTHIHYDCPKTTDSKWHMLGSSAVASQRGSGSRPVAVTLLPRIAEKQD